MVSKNLVTVLVLAAVIIATPSVVSVAFTTETSAVTFFETIADSTTISETWKGPNWIVEASRIGTMTGDISGDYTSIMRLVRHFKGTVEMLVIIQQQFTIDAAFGGYLGNLYITLNYRVEKPSTDLVVKGHWAITGGTGDLVNLHGQGNFTWYVEGSVQTRQFDGQVHFDP